MSVVEICVKWLKAAIRIAAYRSLSLQRLKECEPAQLASIRSSRRTKSGISDKTLFAENCSWEAKAPTQHFMFSSSCCHGKFLDRKSAWHLFEFYNSMNFTYVGEINKPNTPHSLIQTRKYGCFLSCTYETWTIQSAVHLPETIFAKKQRRSMFRKQLIMTFYINTQIQFSGTVKPPFL